MKAEFTLKIMQWAKELRTLNMPLEKKGNAGRIPPGPSLPGISPKTTTSAISPYSFGVSSGLLNIGIHRVLARYFGITTPLNSLEGKVLYEQLALALMDTDTPEIYSQALKEFSEKICRPDKPLCHQCVQQRDCEANRHGFTATLPVKEE